MRRILMLATLAATMAWATAARAADSEATVSASDAGLSGLVTHLVREQLPHEYEKKKNWNQTKEIFDGWHVSRDGLRVKTKRKTRAVNHGTWTMYRIRLTRPDEFTIKIKNLRRLDDGRAGFDAEIAAPLEVFGRLSQWNLGVQLVSLSADCEARAKLTASMAVRLKLASSGALVPDVLIEPEVVSARLELEDFRLKRLSQAHSPLVKFIGKEAREVIEDELAERNGELAAKLNRQIAKKQDKLRLSLADLAGSKFLEYCPRVQRSLLCRPPLPRQRHPRGFAKGCSGSSCERLLPDLQERFTTDGGDFADEFSHFLVDVVGDENYDESGSTAPNSR